MRVQVLLLETLVDYWDHELCLFDLQGETLEIRIDEIYFIPVHIERTGRSSNPMSVQDYIDTYYLPGTQKSGTCVPISQIASFPIKMMVSTVVRVVGSYALHLDT